MAQSGATVTPPNPTPPTNMGFTGTSGPNPPNYTKNTYAELDNWGTGTNSYPPPYYDDGVSEQSPGPINTPSGSIYAVATKASALASGSAATAGGTEGTYPGTGTNYANPNNVGATPASTSETAEAFGTEDVETATGNRTHTYTGGATLDMSKSISVMGNYTTSPNGDHASELELVSISPTTTASGVGTQLLTLTGTGFTSGSVIYVNGVAQTTTVVSATSMTATVTKKTSAGTWPVDVRTGGINGHRTSEEIWTFT